MRYRKYLPVLLVLIALLFLSSLFVLLASDPASAAPRTIPFPDQRDSVATGVAWLIRNHQNDDGGFGNSFSDDSTVRSTVDAVLAIAGAGYNPAAPYPGKSGTAIAYLADNAPELQTYAEDSGGGGGKTVMALSAANQDPRDFASNDWVMTLTEQISTTGQINTDDAFNQSLAILALTAVYEPVPEASITWLKGEQAEDGSWADGFGTESNPDTTALSIMALIASGVEVDDPAVVNGLEFLETSQKTTGGWAYAADFDENANSTALVVQALSAAGEDFYTDDGPWSKDGRSPLSALLSWQSANGGFQADFGQGRFEDFLATVQSIPAASGKPLPVAARLMAAQRAVACLASLQDVATGGWQQFAGTAVNAGGTARAIQAITAVGQDPQAEEWTPGEVNAVEALEALTPDYLASQRGGRTGIVIQGVTAAGEPYDVRDFAGYDLPLTLSSYLSPTGEYDDTAFGVVAHDEAMLGLLAAGDVVDPSAVEYLLNFQVDGDWGAPDGNGLSLNVLGRLGIRVPEAINRLRETQEADGGWGFGVPADPSSTSEIVQGLIQNHENPFSPTWSKLVNGKISNAADAVLHQQGESGCWPSFVSPVDDPFATTDAIMLLVQDPEWPAQEAYLPFINRSGLE